MKTNQVFYLALVIFVIQGGFSEGKKKKSSTKLYLLFSNHSKGKQVTKVYTFKRNRQAVNSLKP